MALAAYKQHRAQRASGNAAETTALPVDLGFGKRNSPFVLNWVLSDTVQQIEWNTAGPIVLRMNDAVSEPIIDTVGADGMKAAIEAMAPFDYVVVQYDSGNSRYIVRFRGVWTGKCVPLLTVEEPVYAETESSPPTAGDADVTIVQDGGKLEGSTLWFRPMGGPRPKDLAVETRASSSILISGTYRWAVSFFSSDFGIESKLSNVTENIGLNNSRARLKIPIPDTMMFNGTIPPDEGGVDGIQFIQPFNRIRIYRERLGSLNRTSEVWQITHTVYNDFLEFSIEMPNGDSTGNITMKDNQYTAVDSSTEEEIVAAFAAAGYTVEVTRNSALDEDDQFTILFTGDNAGENIELYNFIDGISGTGSVSVKVVQEGGQEKEIDGVGASNGLYLIEEVAIDPSRIGNFQSYYDFTGDAQYSTAYPALGFDNPPEDARLAARTNTLAVYANGRAGDNKIWIAELPQNGNLRFGELGDEYVFSRSFDEQIQTEIGDDPMIGLAAIGGRLLIGYARTLISGDIKARQNTAVSNYRILNESIGFASQHAIVLARDFINTNFAAGQALWIGPDGFIYSFSEGVTRILSDRLDKTSLELIRRTWVQDQAFGDIRSWAMDTAVVDQIERRVIFTALKDAGSIPMQIVYDLQTQAVIPWNIPSRVFWCQREWDESAGQKFRPVIMFAIGTTIYRMVDGAGDDGVAFNYHAETGDLPMIDGFMPATIKDVALEVEKRVFDGEVSSDAQLALYRNSSDDLEVLFTHNDAPKRFTIDPNTGLAFVNSYTEEARRIRLRWFGTQIDGQDHAELLAISIMAAPSGKATR